MRGIALGRRSCWALTSSSCGRRSADGKNGRSASDGELVRLYAHRGAVPRDRWYELLEATTERLDVLVHAGLFLPDGRSDLAALVRRKAEDGVEVRLLYGDPDCDAVALRGAEEGIGDGLAARIRLVLGYMREALEAPERLCAAARRRRSTTRSTASTTTCS